MKLYEFNALQWCPACGGKSLTPTFSTSKTVPIGDGRGHVDVRTVGDAPVPHLRVKCDRCGLWWCTEVCEGKLVAGMFGVDHG